MKDALIRSGLRRVGVGALERLMWAVDFAQRPLETPGDLANAELELTCFRYGPNLSHLPDPPSQIKAFMTNPISKNDSYRGQEVFQAQALFNQVLRASGGAGQIELPLKYVIVQFTRAHGVEYVSRIPNRLGQSASEHTEAKIEAVVFRLIRLLDQTVRTGLAKAKGGERFIPLRLYVGICPLKVDGCGNLFAKSRIDQDYCSRTCVSRAQVRRFRRKQNKS